MAITPPVKRAKSRLAQSSAKPRQPTRQQRIFSTSTKAHSRLTKRTNKLKFSIKFNPPKIDWLKPINAFYYQRLAYMPFLILGLLFLLLTGLLVIYVSPSHLANIPFYQTYGLFLLLVLLATSCLGILLFAHYRRGLLIGLFVTITLLLHFQDFSLKTLELFTVGIFFIVIELILTLAEKFSWRVKPHPHHRRHRV